MEWHYVVSRISDDNPDWIGTRHQLYEQDGELMVQFQRVIIADNGSDIRIQDTGYSVPLYAIECAVDTIRGQGLGMRAGNHG